MVLLIGMKFEENLSIGFVLIYLTHTSLIVNLCIPPLYSKQLVAIAVTTSKIRLQRPQADDVVTEAAVVKKVEAKGVHSLYKSEEFLLRYAGCYMQRQNKNIAMCIEVCKR